jgi:hypothetical protein
MGRVSARVVSITALLTLLPAGARGDAAPADPRALAPLLRVQDFTEFEAAIPALEASGARTREGWLALPRTLFALGVASADDPALAAGLEAWRRASPDRWEIEMVSGWRQLLLLHTARADDGSLDAPEIPEQPDPALRAAARSAFERAQALSPHSPEPGAALLGVAVMEGAPIADRLAMLAQACAVDRVCESARVVMLTGLDPEHGGNADALLTFARESARAHPGNPNLGLLLGIAHRKAGAVAGDRSAYFQDPRVVDEVERAYGGYLAAYPTARLHANEYARLACWAGRRDTARRTFETIGDAFRAAAWNGDFREFAGRRHWALAPDPIAVR